MRKLLVIFGLLAGVFTAQAQEVGDLSAPAIASAPDDGVAPVAPKKSFLPMHRRFDREIGRIKFVRKGETTLGLTVSYGTMSSSDSDLFLLLDGLNVKANIFTVKPSVGYVFSDNFSAGIRFGYSKIGISLDDAALNLGNMFDMDLSLSDIHYRSNAITGGLFVRSYAGLDARGTFAVFGELDLSVRSGTTHFSYPAGDAAKATESRQLRVGIGFHPGLAVFIMPNVCTTFSVGLGGIEYSQVRQFDPDGKQIGSRWSSKMRFRIDLLAINIGVTVHLWDKKSHKS